MIDHRYTDNELRRKALGYTVLAAIVAGLIILAII